MANVTITNPVGLAERVQCLQKDLYGHLVRVWGLTADTYNAYGLCYKNKSDKGYIPEAYTGGIDYEEIGHNDKVYATSFFGKGDTSNINARTYQTDVHLIVCLNLSKLTGIKDITHRADFEARQVVYDYIRQGMYGFQVTQEITGVENVLREYNGIPKEANVWKVADMGKNHIFRFNLQCTYDLTARINKIN